MAVGIILYVLIEKKILSILCKTRVPVMSGYPILH